MSGGYMSGAGVDGGTEARRPRRRPSRLPRSWSEAAAEGALLPPQPHQRDATSAAAGDTPKRSGVTAGETRRSRRESRASDGNADGGGCTFEFSAAPPPQPSRGEAKPVTAADPPQDAPPLPLPRHAPPQAHLLPTPPRESEQPPAGVGNGGSKGGSPEGAPRRGSPTGRRHAPWKGGCFTRAVVHSRPATARAPPPPNVYGPGPIERAVATGDATNPALFPPRPRTASSDADAARSHLSAMPGARGELHVRRPARQQRRQRQPHNQRASAACEGADQAAGLTFRADGSGSAVGARACRPVRPSVRPRRPSPPRFCASAAASSRS